MAYIPIPNQSVSGTVGASIIGKPPVSIPDIVNIAGSVATTPPANQSVSGAVQVSNFPTNQNVSGSVIAQLSSSNASVITVGSPVANQSVSGTVQTDVRSSVAVAIVSGSVAVATGNSSVQVLNFPTNTSVSGAISVSNFPTTQNVSGSVAAWLNSSNASVITVGSPVANQSVSGTVGASVTGHAPVVIVGGSIAASFTPPANQSVSGEISVSNFPTSQNVNGSVVAFQGGAPWANTNVGSVITVGQGSVAVNIIAGSVAVSVTPPANQSVSGTVQTDVRGSVAVAIISGSVAVATGNSSVQVLNFPANQSVSGAVSVSNFPTTQNVSGSVAAFLAGSTNASVITVGTAAPNQSVSGTVQAEQTGTRITSVVNSIPSSMLVGASIIGLTPVNVTFPTNQNVSGSVVSFQGTNPWIITGSVQAELTPAANQSVSGTVGASVIGLTPVAVSNFPTNQNVSGSVVSFQGGTQVTSLVSTVPSSVIVGTSIFGQLPAGTAPLGSVAVLQGTMPWTINSVYGNISGSVAATITNTNVNVSGSVVAFGFPTTQNVSGSVAAFVVGSASLITIQQAQSIVGTYAEDAAHTTADKGVFVLGVRNDAVSSITSAERDYSPLAVDEVGRNIVVPFAGQQACIISYTGSVVSGSVTLIKASVVGSRSYITDFWVTNTGSVAQLITFQGGDTSVIGYTIAPAGGGSNSPGIAIPLRTTLSQDLAFKATGTSSVIYMTVKGYQAP